jgi:xanthine dehydrogenase accessory factor
MRELREILEAFEALCVAGRPAALATVVRVEGSAYRRSGARMLVAEDGRCWGGVSGGCLDRDVLRRAIGVITTGRPIVARYDTTDDEGLASGVATGCRGVVEVFIERVDGRAAGPLDWFGRVIRGRRPCAIATVIRARMSERLHGGARLMIDEAGGVEGELGDSEIAESICELLANAPAPFAARVENIGGADVFVELIVPPQAVVIFGGGPDVVPVVQIAKSLGWRVTVVAARPATGLRERFALADEALVTSSERPTEGVAIGADDAVVLMTHNFPRDVQIVSALRSEPRYLGILGPRQRTRQLMAEVSAAGGGSAALHRWDVRAPAGLDVGAESPAEIALSIVAEIQAVVRGASAGFLRDRAGPIHERAEGADEDAAAAAAAAAADDTGQRGARCAM